MKKPQALKQKITKKLNTLLLTEISRAGSPDLMAERRAEMKHNPNTVARLAALGIHYAVHGTSPQMILKALERPYTKAGYEVLGHGYHTTALHAPDSNEIMKVVRGSEALSDEQRSELVATYTDQIAHNSRTHPEITLPTTAGIYPSPLNGKPMVMLKQPLARPTGEVAVPATVRDFAQKSLDHMKDTGYLPDVAGANNLYMTSEGLRLVDTLPIDGSKNEKVFGRCALLLAQMAEDGKLPER